jgi:predicted ATPase/DNA-binding SARP family transcriptional activator
MLEVRFFGQFEILRDGKPLTIPTRNAQSLFAYLVLNAGKAQRRERLAGLLWPDSSEDNARSNLRHELWRLRKALESEGETYFQVDDLTITFNPHCDCLLDLDKLERVPLESSADELIEALCAYQGELLPGFYDEWVLAERSRFQARFESLIARLIDILQAEGRWPEILDWAMRWTTLAEWSEPAYRAMMSAYANRGDLAKAATTYESFSQGLQNDLGIKPSPQTQELYQRIKAGWKADAPAKALVRQSTFPATRASPASVIQRIKHSNLPRPLTSFIGREKEIHQVRDLVSRYRLVTITGTGGVGKTRLAIQTASELPTQFKDGIWWVELASLFKTNPSRIEKDPGDLAGMDLVAQAVAKSLRIPESTDIPLLERVIEHLYDLQALLILDNCEHLIAACAGFIERLLGECLELTILTTSREALGVPGEKAWYLPSLSLPENMPSLGLDQVLESEAVSLFVERSAEVLPSFQPGEKDALTITQICRRLDGIPLAIELAAARMNLLSANEISSRLDQRFSLLTSGRRTVLPRHQTLRAAIEWGYDLLSEKEKVFFRRLSVFAGSFTLEAAEAVSTGEDIDCEDVVTLLGKLLDKSLLNVELAPQDPDFSTRYRLLDTIRSYGRLKLVEAQETRRMQDKYAAFYVRFVEAAEHGLLGPQQLPWLTRLKEEQNNLQAVLQWSIDSQDAEKALKLVGSLWRYWWMHSHHSEGREWLGLALSIPVPQPPDLRAKALNGAGILARGQGDFEKASIFLTECLDIQRGLGDKRGIANALNSLGILTHLQGEYSKALHHYQESLDYRREIGDTRGIALSLHNMSMIYQEKSELNKAEELLNESLSLFLEVKDTRNIAASQLYLGYVMFELGDIEQSEDLFRRSLLSLKDLGGRNDIIECLEGFAGIAAHLKQPLRAVRLLAFAQGLRNVIGIQVPRYHQLRYQHIEESIANQLDSLALEKCKTEGRQMSMDEAIEYALGRIE